MSKATNKVGQGVVSAQQADKWTGCTALLQ